jgi:hypothetical protein
MAATSMYATIADRVLRRQLVKYDEGVSWPPTCKDARPGEELGDVTKKRGEDRD